MAYRPMRFEDAADRAEAEGEAADCPVDEELLRQVRAYEAERGQRRGENDADHQDDSR